MSGAFLILNLRAISMGSIVFQIGGSGRHTLEAKWSMLTDYLQIFLDGEEKAHMTFSFTLPRSVRFSVNDGNEKFDLELKMTPDLVRMQRFRLFVNGREQFPVNLQWEMSYDIRSLKLNWETIFYQTFEHLFWNSKRNRIWSISSTLSTWHCNSSILRCFKTAKRFYQEDLGASLNLFG